MLKAGQGGSGGDLGIFLIDVLGKGGKEVGVEEKSRFSFPVLLLFGSGNLVLQVVIEKLGGCRVMGKEGCLLMWGCIYRQTLDDITGISQERADEEEVCDGDDQLVW